MRSIKQKERHRPVSQFRLEDKLLTDRDLAEMYSVSRATIWRWSKEGHIPPPIKIAGSTRWRGADVVPK